MKIKIKNEAPFAPTMQAVGGSVKKAYDFVENNESELEINMYGEVVEDVPVDWWTGKPIGGLYICEKDFLEDLDQYKEKSKITIRINSVGGDLYAGIAIANRLNGLEAEITTIADALCASAAVAIYQTGDTRKVFTGSQIMIHEPSCCIYGRYDVKGIKKLERQLEAAKKSIVETYKERTGRTEDEIKKMVTDDTWMTGQEAIDEGFADELIEGNVSVGVTEDKQAVISNGIMFRAKDFLSLPRNLRILKNEMESGEKMPAIIDEDKGGKEIMTKQELMNSQPDLYKEIVEDVKKELSGEVSKAVKEERERIKEIDEIANSVGDEKMVKDAMFGEKPLNASELALAALRKQNQLGAQFIEKAEEDVSDSGVNDVKPKPNAGTKSKEEQEEQDIMDGAALILGKSEGGAK